MSKDKKVAGIWIDHDKAVVVSNHDAQDVFEFEIKGTAKMHHQKGNSNENAAMNAEQTNKAKYFKEIEGLLTNSVECFITGPGIIQEELKHHLEDTAQYKNMKIKLGTSNQMSDEQVLDLVKEHYHA